MNANSIGSVTPTKNAETELAKTKHKLVFDSSSQYDTSPKLLPVYQTS